MGMGKIKDTRKNLKVSEAMHYNLKLLACEKKMTMAQTLNMLVVNELMKGGSRRGDNKRQGTGETAGEGAGRGVNEE